MGDKLDQLGSFDAFSLPLSEALVVLKAMGAHELSLMEQHVVDIHVHFDSLSEIKFPEVLSAARNVLAVAELMSKGTNQSIASTTFNAELISMEVQIGVFAQYCANVKALSIDDYCSNSSLPQKTTVDCKLQHSLIA